MDDSTQELILELLDDGKSASEIVKELKKDHDIKVSKATVNRCRTLLTAFGDDKKLSPQEREIYFSYMEKKIQKENTATKISHTTFQPIFRTAVDGPFDPNMPEMMQGHQNFMNNYVPQNVSEPISVDVNSEGKILSHPTPFTAVSRKFGDDDDDNIQAPKFFWNPYTALDLIVFQDVYTHTICGTIIDVVVAFLVGMGIHPVLKLVNEEDVELKEKKIPEKEQKESIKEKQEANREESETEIPQDPVTPDPEPKMESKQEAIKRETDENKFLLDPLFEVDRWIGDRTKQEGIAESFDSKVEALVRNHYVFGRDLMTKERNKDHPFEWKGKKYDKIKTIYKVQHPRDINFIEIDQKSFNVKRVSLMWSLRMLERDDMIYLAHQENSAIYNGKGYGYSLQQRMLGHGRSLRKLVDRDFPNVASVGYAPFTIVATKRDEKGTKNEASQGKTFINTMVAGQPNHTALKDPEHDLVVHSIDTKPDIPGMIDMANFHAESAAKVAQVPTALVAKEKDPNRDTLLGILRVFAETEIPRKRVPVIDVFTNQHYMPNFREIYKDKPEILKKWRVEAEFTDVKIDSWADIIGAFVELNKVFRFTADAAGVMLNIDNLESKIDSEKEPIGESSFDMGNGNKLSMSKSPIPKKST